MVNSRESLAKIPSMNNDANPYIVTLDIYKEGYWAYDISNYYKGRVDDNGTPFMVRWFEHGQLKNVQGLRPFIRGTVGQHTIDDQTDPDNPKVVPSPDCSQIDQTGETTDTAPGGIAIYRMVNACFTQEGMFYGEIGLKNSSGLVLSSVDIAFKVLGGSMNMLGARKFYVSEFEKALDNLNEIIENTKKDFSQELKQVIDDARNAYESETKNVHDSLDALNSEISENRQFQHNLNDQLKGTQDQIRINDVVRRQEFEDLSGKINEQLAHMNFQPDYYLNYQDMTAKNPQGTHNACVTTDNYHIWLYNFDTNQWQDGGQMTNYGLDEQTKTAIGMFDHDNLIYDPDFRFSDSWTNWGHGKPLVVDLYQHSSVGSSNVLSVSEIDKGASLSSRDIPVKGITKISYGALINLTHAEGLASISIWGTNDKNTYKISGINLKNDIDDELHLQKSTHCDIPAGTKTIRMSFELNDKGTMKICRPRIYASDYWIPYDHESISKRIDHVENFNANESNLLNSKDLNEFAGFRHSDSMSVEVVQNPFFNSSQVAKVTNNKEAPASFTTPSIANSNSEDAHISLGFWLKSNVEPYVNVWWSFKNKTNNAWNPKIDFKTDGQWHFYKLENVLVGSAVENISMDIVLNGVGTFEVTRMQFNFGDKLKPYDALDVQQNVNNQVLPLITGDNEILDFKFKSNNYWANRSNGKPIKIEYTEDKACGNANVVKLTEIDKGGAYASPLISVGKNEFVSYGAFASVTGAKGTAYIGLWTENGNLFTTIPLSNSDGKVLTKYQKLNVKIPSGTEKIYFTMALSDKGTLKVGLPSIKFGKQYYSDLPILDIETDEEIAFDWAQAPFVFKDKSRSINGYLQISIQGDSSRLFPKKNYKIKTFKDAEFTKKLNWRPKSSWNANNKFNLKANWVDATQARNLTNARIFERASDVTPFENDQVAEKLSHAQAMGQMEGFPIELYLNGQYNGLYTLNTKKDDKTFGMDSDNVGEEGIVFEDVDSQLKNYPTAFDGHDYSTIVQDNPTATLKNNFDNFIKFLNTASDEDIKTNLKNYIDVHSVMNTYLWGVLAEVWDTSAKSNLLLTYNNGAYWYMVPYDMDSTWSLKPDGNIYDVPLPEYDFKNIDNDTYMQFVTEKNDMKLFDIVYRVFKPELQKQYFKLRQDVWSNSKIIDAYKHFIDSIPQEAYEREHERWPQVPSYEKADFSQLQYAIIKRGNSMDNFMEHLTDSQPASPAPQPTTPQVQPAGGTTPATPQTQPAKQETGETSSKPAETQAQPTEPKQ